MCAPVVLCVTNLNRDGKLKDSKLEKSKISIGSKASGWNSLEETSYITPTTHIASGAGLYASVFPIKCLIELNFDRINRSGG